MSTFQLIDRISIKVCYNNFAKKEQKEKGMPILFDRLIA